jgi:hypothetical protein
VNDASDIHPDLDWAASGAMALTGFADAAPLLAPSAVTSVARTALGSLARSAAEIRALRAEPILALDAAALLGERAACFGQSERRGTTSVGGTCRMHRCADGWIALNLARPEDVGLLAAWLEDDVHGEPEDFLPARLRRRGVEHWIERGRLLGLPVASVPRADRDAHVDSTGSARNREDAWMHVAARGPALAETSRARPPLVVDLSSLWAGPLCTHLLALAGADVIKVESTRRPDGARRGPAAFFDLMNAGKQSVALDFTAHDGRRLLTHLLARADIVVESARPRALAQLGIDAHALVRSHPGLVWVSITGYGREEPMGHWVAFGDDAAAAAGLLVTTRRSAAPRGGGTDGKHREETVPVFCADAIADPLTGLHAASAALAAWQHGGGVLLDVALSRVAASALRHCVALPRAIVRKQAADRGDGDWVVTADGRTCTVAPPRARAVAGKAAEHGADTRAVLAELRIAC